MDLFAHIIQVFGRTVGLWLSAQADSPLFEDKNDLRGEVVCPIY
jgi:hypothetical protein